MSDKNDTPTGGSNANDPHGNGGNNDPMDFLRRLLGGNPGGGSAGSSSGMPGAGGASGGFNLNDLGGFSFGFGPTPGSSNTD